MLAHLWVSLAGPSPTSNRLFAGVMDVVIEALMFLIGRRIGGAMTGALAAIFYIFLEVNSWSYLDLSELPSVMFALCAMYFGLSFSRPALKAEIARPFWFGVCLSLSFLARFMAIPLIGCIALLPLLDSNFPRKIKRCALPVAFGFAAPIATTCLYFAAIGSLSAMLFWGLLYNFGAKSRIVYKAWIGDLSVLAIRQTWLFIGVALLISLICCLLAWTRKNEGIMRGLLICWLPAFGGWVGANPSGIGGVIFHAIPALPFVCLSLTFGVTTLWSQPAFPPKGWMWPLRLAAAAAAVFAIFPFARTTSVMAASHPVDPHYDHTARVGEYIAQHTKPTDSIFVFGADPLIYVDAHRNNGTEFSIVVDYVARMQDRMLDELKKSHPGAVVFDKTDYWHYRNLEAFPKVAAYIAKNYRVSRQFDDVLLTPSAEATAPVLLDPDTLELLRAAGSPIQVDYHWNRVQALIPPGSGHVLHFSTENEWNEFSTPTHVNFTSLGSIKSLFIEMQVAVTGPPGSFQKYPLRVLVAGRHGQALKEFRWSWVPIVVRPAPQTLHVPLTAFDEVSGDFSWDEVDSIQVGGWGPAGGKVIVYSADVLAPR